MSLRLETGRLSLRPFEERDAASFAAYRNDPLVAEYQGWELPYTAQQVAEFVANMRGREPATPGEWYQLAIERRDSGAMIGDCAFVVLRDGRQAEIGFTLARDQQGQGYGVEAVGRLLAYLLGELNLHRVQANCDVLNPASARLMERVGMRREAHLVENVWMKGRWTSEYWYGLLRREWLARRGEG